MLRKSRTGRTARSGGDLATGRVMRTMSLLVGVVALAIGCGNKESSPPESQPSDRPTTTVVKPSAPSPVEEARTTFSTVCAACHGESGHGDGVAAAALNP